MKRLIQILFFSITLSAHSQNLSVSSAYLQNRYFSSRNELGSTSFESGNGFLIDVGLDSIRFDSLDLFITLRFENYDGYFRTYSGMAGWGSTTAANTEKYVLGLGLYILNEPFFKKGIIRFGFVYSYLISYRFSGFHSYWAGMSTSRVEFADDPSYIRNESTFGIDLRMSLPFQVGKIWQIAPFYSCYAGIFEFRNTECGVGSWRNYGGLSLSWRMK